MTLTPDFKKMLVAQTAEARRHTNGTRWDTAGIVAGIDRIGHWSPAGAMVECGLAAADAGAKTPGVIGTNGPHRRVAIPTPAFVPRTLDPNERCSICSKDETSCRLTHGGDIHHGIDPHEFKSAAMAAKHANELSDAAKVTAMAAIRDAIEPTEEKPVKTLDDLRDTKPELAARLARIVAVVPAVAMREPQPETEAVDA